MADFNRYVITVEVENRGVEHSYTDEVNFSIAAISVSAARSAIPLNQITTVEEYEITDIKEQND